MSNIVTWKTATEIIEILKSENALVSGMSVAEAAAALGYVKSAGGVYIKTVMTTAAESVAGTTAAGVAEAATATASTTATNLALYETSAGTAAVAGVGAVAAPIAATMAASAGGYLIGNQIYKSNSDFLDKLMFPVYDYFTGWDVTSTLYKDQEVPTVPLLFDENGNTFLPSGLVSAINLYLGSIPDDPNLPTTIPSAFLATYGITGETNFDTCKDVKIYQGVYNGGTVKDIVIWGTPTYSTIVETKYPDQGVKSLGIRYPNADGKQYMYRSENGGSYYRVGRTFDCYYGEGLASSVPINDSYASYYATQFGTTKTWIYSTNGLIIEGTQKYPIPKSGLPSGVTKYTPGTSPSPLIIPNAPTWTPAELPATSPQEMPEPARNPDPTRTPERITPYINPVQPQPKDVPIKKPTTIPTTTPVLPVINPQPDTSVAPATQPDPNKDPSQGTTPSTDPTPSSPTVPAPNSTGSPTVTPTPIITPFSAANGLLHVYNPTSAEIDQFGAWLWTTFSGNLIDTLSKLFNNPMDAVIGLHELYCTPTTGSTTTIKAGYLDSGVTSRLVTSRYVEIPCGAISIPEFWGNYLDYSPYTKTYCYLPFIGIVELNADDIVGHGVEITYRVDTYNGSCIALITTAKVGSPEAMTYQYSGNCSVELPITSGMKSAIQGALIGAATLAVGAASGGAGGLVAASALGAIKGGASSKNTVQHSGSFGSSYGAMGIKKPYMIVKRPIQKVVYGYNENYGYPAHKKVTVSECTGYMKVIEVNVISSTATEEEKKMIETQLKSGIFVS